MEPKPGIYHHFKDPTKHYQVLGIAFNTETEEDMVVYKPLYECDKELFVRPRTVFLAEVDKPELGYKGPRFVFIESSAGA